MTRLLLACALLGSLALSVSAQCSTAISGSSQTEACVFGTGNTAMTRTVTVTPADLMNTNYIVYIFNMGISSTTTSSNWVATTPTITPSAGWTQLSMSTPYSVSSVAYSFTRPGTYTVTYTPSTNTLTSTVRTGFYMGQWTGSSTSAPAAAAAELSPTVSGTSVAMAATSFLALGTYEITKVNLPSSMRRKEVQVAYTSNTATPYVTLQGITGGLVIAASSRRFLDAAATSQFSIELSYLDDSSLRDALNDETVAPMIEVSTLTAAFTDYPVLPADGSSVTINAATDASNPSSSEWYRVAVGSPTWWTLTMGWTATSSSVYHRAVFVTDTTSTLSSATKYTSDFGSGSTVLRNPMLMKSSPATSVNAAPIMVRYNTFTSNTILVRIEGSGSLASGALTATAAGLSGECQTNRDCYVEDDDHPARGGFMSANSDVERFGSCVAFPSTSNLMYQETHCVECFTNSHCNEGQYCHTDFGVCSTNAGSWICDLASYQKAGRCIDRDPLKNVVGKGCTTDGDSANIGVFGYATGTYSQGQIVASEGIDFKSDDDFITGTGFCGQALYYNSSNSFELTNIRVASLSPSNLARTILWSGKCVSHVCQECVNGDSLQGFDCVNGLWKKHITVDQTIRTITSNTTASGILAVGIFAALGFLAIVGVMIQAHMYRKQSRKEEEDAKAAAAEAKALEELREAEAAQAQKDADARAAAKDAEEGEGEGGAGESKAATVE